LKLLPGAVLTLACVSPLVAGSPAEVRWPHKARAAVSLTYDDALETQIRNAGPALEKHHLKATFFLTGESDSLKNQRKEWVALSLRGHELASHTMHHPCPRFHDWVPKGFALEDYTLERLSKELDASIALVHELTSREEPLTFAYPCGDQYVGEGSSRASYVPLIEAKFLAARGTETRVAMPGAFSFSQVPTADDTDRSGRALVEWVKKAEEQGGWVVFIFHGIGGQHIPTTLEAHDELLDYLAKNKKKVWTAPFGKVAALLKTPR
jgi:peptidoglycan-N-acetylglucosamine deacetylase